MSCLHIANYALGAWRHGSGPLTGIASAITDQTIAEAGSKGLDFAAMHSYARDIGGPALRALTFHQRAHLVKALALAIMKRKEDLYALSIHSGAPRKDGWIDIEGGAGTLFSIASKSKRELPDRGLLIDGDTETISKKGSFLARHVYTPRQGVAIHINAYNFPVWGMLEKLGPALIAGMPVIVKPATVTCYLAEACMRIIVETGLLPDGAVQFIAGPVGDLIDHLDGQDVISFTGSAETATMLKTHPRVMSESVRFIAEQDSLNACLLGPDADADSPEFALFVTEVIREMTVKAGQKCTAIRRAIVPSGLIDQVAEALRRRLADVTVGDPRAKETTMGPLVSRAQRDNVRASIDRLRADTGIIAGDPNDDIASSGAYMRPILLRCDSPAPASVVHRVEAFGPVATLMPYRDLDDAIGLCRAGKGSLVMSLFTHDGACACAVVEGAASHHGRIAIIDRDCAGESTGHGSPLPVLVHGGPGRAGGGEEMGGVRGLKHYMQRTAIQGAPDTLTAVSGDWAHGSATDRRTPHPFRIPFDELAIGKSIETGSRTITLADIEHFASFTGDVFYAHMNEKAAAASPFFPGRVAHGYLLLSFAAGLFVDPEPGPVLANYGLDNLRFMHPVSPGDTITVTLTAKAKKKRNDDYGEVRWDVLIINQDQESVASYDLLTMNALKWT